MNLNLFKNARYCLCIFFLVNTIKAQQTADSIQQPHNLPLIDYPKKRQLSLDYDQSGWTNYTINFKDKPQEQGEMNRNRLQLLANIPLFKTKRFTANVSELYTHEEIKIKDVINASYRDVQNNQSFEDFKTSLNLTYSNKLFNKPFIANASLVAGSSNFFDVQKISGLVTGLIVFQKHPETRYLLGIAAILDPSSQIPAFPIFNYWHRFKNPKWEVDAILPSSIKFRRSETFGGWLSVGTDFKSYSLFLKKKPEILNGNYENIYSEMTFSFTYEKFLNKYLFFSLQSGYKTTLQSNIVKVNERINDKIAVVKYGNNCYIKAGISIVIPDKKR